MTDYRIIWKSARFTDRFSAYAFANKKRDEFDHFSSTTTGVAYNDAVIRMTEEPKSDGATLYIVEYRVAEKIPFALSISHKVDGDALKMLPKPQRDILTSRIASDDWDLRKLKWKLPEYLRKGRLKGGGQDVKDE